MKETKIAIIGLGYWGPNLLRNFNNLGVVQYAFDLDPQKIKKFSSNPAYSHIKFGTSYKQVITDKKLTAVVVATPPDTHYDVALECLKHSKHVFIEKPMTLDVEESENLIVLAERKKKLLMVGHTFLYTPEVRKIKEIIDAGELGTVQYIHASRLNLGKFQRSNVVADLSPHDISIFNYLLDDKIKSVFSQGYSFVDKKVIEVAFVTFEYEKGAVCNLHLSWLDPLKKRTTTIVGDKKMLVYDMMAEEKLKIYDKGVDILEDTSDYGKYMLSYRHGDIWSPHTDVWEPLALECKHFIDCIEGKDELLTNGYNGRDVVQGLVAALDSLELGEKVCL
jgi:predicted dehydrogenase